MGDFISRVLFFVCLIVYSSVVFGYVDEENSLDKSKVLSRRKRHLTFPDGSSFSCAGCMTVGVIGQPQSVPGTFTFGLNWAISYELPNATETLDFYHKKYKLKYQKAMAKRRNRRELYRKLEAILENIGYNGRQCVLKTLCETKQRIAPNGQNMIEEMFRRIFTLPLLKVLPLEPLEHSVYDAAHRLGNLLEDCDSFPCPISLVDWAKGYYNAPSPTVDLARHPWSLAIPSDRLNF